MEKIEALLKKSIVCRLGINDGSGPYIVPLSFGYRNHTLYFHSGAKGKKLDLLKADPNVCFEFDRIEAVVAAKNPCDWDIRYQSIIGTGKAEFIEKAEEKKEALKIIISQYSESQVDIPETRVKAAVVFKVAIESMTFKENPN